MKTVDTLVDDIYALMVSKEVPEGVSLEAEIDRFGVYCKDLMRTLFTRERDDRKLRMSNIGRPDRFLWNAVNNPQEQEEFTGNTYVKFMYGHLIEEMLIFLTRLSGHEVTDEQKKCEVAGIKGSMDCKIDGIVTDVKSTSYLPLRSSRMETLLSMILLDTWLRSKDTHTQKEKQSSGG